MEFYNFWARSEAIPANGEKVKFVKCVGYSNESTADALRVANERAQHAASMMNNNQPLDYSYRQLPFREEVIERFTQDDELVTVLSRVHYGAIVLNTTQVLFADIDLPQGKPKAKSGGGLFSFFSKKKPATPPKPPGSDLIKKIEQLCEASPYLGLRLYRTAAGFRCMATSSTYAVNDDKATELLKSLRSDELYVTLCRRQRCFRARLTPKPHRLGMRQPPHHFPSQNQQEETAMKQWLQEYEEKSKQYATCALVGQFGNQQISPDVESILELHEHFSCSDSLPLA